MELLLWLPVGFLAGLGLHAAFGLMDLIEHRLTRRSSR